MQSYGLVRPFSKFSRVLKISRGYYNYLITNVL